MQVDVRSWPAAAVLAIGLFATTGCDSKEPPPRRQAILLLLDAARPDRFSCYGYERATTPEMDRLADHGMLFRDHFAQATYTRRSVSSLIYSRYYCLPLFPSSSQVPLANPSDLFRRRDDAQISFVAALRSAGFKTAAISAHLWTGEGTAFADAFDEMHDLATRLKDRKQTYPKAEAVINRAIEWIRDNKHEDYFLYVHLMDPHHPHEFGDDARVFFGSSTHASESLSDLAARKSEGDRRYANALYDGSMRYTDRHVGRLIDLLRSENLIDDTVVMITADHGEYLFDPPDRKLFKHGGPWRDPVAKIPLIVHYPKQLRHGEFKHFSEGVDVGPTLLSLLDVSIPEDKELDGLDLVKVIDGQVSSKESVLCRGGIRTKRYKCLFETPDEVLLGRQPPETPVLKGRLYDLLEDPHETSDVFASSPDIVAALLGRYRSRLMKGYSRYQAARSSDQPQSAFAISAKNMASARRLPTMPYALFVRQMNDGVFKRDAGRRIVRGSWARYAAGSKHVIAAFNTRNPLELRFRLPNGTYNLSVRTDGRASVQVDGRLHELKRDPVSELGSVTVTDEVFRATIRPEGSPIALRFFGFRPAAADQEDPKIAEDRLQRLKSLGYIGD